MTSVGNCVGSVVFLSVEVLLRLFQNPLSEVSLIKGNRWLPDLVLPVAGQHMGVLLGTFQAVLVEWAKPLISQSDWRIKGNKSECGNAGEKGRDSPLRRGVLMSRAATAIYKVSGCQQPGWCIPRYVFQHCQETAEEPSWRGLQCLVSTPHPTFCTQNILWHLIWMGFLLTGSAQCLGDAFTVLLLHVPYPTESVASPSAMGSKNELIKAVTPCPACWRSRCCSTPWGGFASLSFRRAQWQIPFYSYFCRSVFEKPTCYKAGNTHQPVENSWLAWNRVLSPCWQEK